MLTLVTVILPKCPPKQRFAANRIENKSETKLPLSSAGAASDAAGVNLPLGGKLNALHTPAAAKQHLEVRLCRRMCTARVMDVMCE